MLRNSGATKSRWLRHHWFLWIFESTDGFSTGSPFAGEDNDDWSGRKNQDSRGLRHNKIWWLKFNDIPQNCNFYKTVKWRTKKRTNLSCSLMKSKDSFKGAAAIGGQMSPTWFSAANSLALTEEQTFNKSPDSFNEGRRRLEAKCHLRDFQLQTAWLRKVRICL